MTLLDVYFTLTASLGPNSDALPVVNISPDAALYPASGAGQLQVQVNDGR